MTDPGDADLTDFDLGEKRESAFAGALREERWDEDAGQEITLMPIGAGAKADAGGSALGVEAVL